MKKIVFILLLLNSTTYSYSQTSSEFFTEADTFLKTHVKNGKVDYQGVINNQEELTKLTKMIADLSVSKSKPSEYQSFWINAYNILVIQGIVDNYPIKSPLDKAGFFDKITYKAAGKDITLNDIENKMLRAVFPKEARFHFVLVCAGLGCPPIISEAYTPSKLEKQLTAQTVKALNDPTFIKVGKKKVEISQLFDWYKEDFVQDGKTYISYINQYRKEKLPENAKISFYTYNWALNDLK